MQARWTERGTWVKAAFETFYGGVLASARYYNAQNTEFLDNRRGPFSVSTLIILLSMISLNTALQAIATLGNCANWKFK